MAPEIPGPISEFSNKLITISNYDKKSLIERNEWGSANFKEFEEYFNEIFFFVSEFKRYDYNFIPQANFTQINQALESINSIFSHINSYNVAQQAKSQIDSLCRQLPSHIEQLKSFESQWLPILAYKKGDFEEKINKIDSVLEIANDKRELMHIKYDEFETERASILQAMREASASAGVAVFNSDFDEQSDRNQVDAKYWGWWLIVLSFLTAFISGVMFFYSPQNPDITLLISSKILIMLVFITATLWCGRMYKSCKHQQATNKFKANALRTFQAFIRATNDENTKNAVLLETTKAIFSNFNPGYLSDNGSQSDSIKVLELFKSAQKND